MLILGVVVVGSALKGLYLDVVGKSAGLKLLSSCLLKLLSFCLLSCGLNPWKTDPSLA